MKKAILSFLGCLAFSTAIRAQVSANFGAPKFAPADGKKLLIMGQDLGAVGGLDNYTNGYVDNLTAHLPAGVTSYTSLPSLDGLTELANWGSGDVRAQAYLEDPTFDHSFIVIGLYLVGVLDGVISGAQDASVEELATWVKGQDRPVFIRIGYEFEGSWNNYDPVKYKDAWKHIVHVFDAQEVRNAAYVWQSSGQNGAAIANWYPGDEYVNWVGYSHFDGVNMGQDMREFAQAHNKPIMIAEATPRVDLMSGSGQSHWQNWYQPLFDGIYANDRIKVLAYINVDWDSQPMWQGQGWGDSRVQVSAVVKANWENEISKTPWLTAATDLFNQINYGSWILNEASEPQVGGDAELLMLNEQNQLRVSRKNGGMMEGVEVWDFSGRLVFTDDSTRQEYSIHLEDIPLGGLVVCVTAEGKKWKGIKVFNKK